MAVQKNHFVQFLDSIRQNPPLRWEDISGLLTKTMNSQMPSQPYTKEEFLRICAKGTAFIAFEYGVDGVSIEIAKYARSLEGLYKRMGESQIHLIGGDFSSHTEILFKSDWHRCRIKGTNGWSKWEEGKWFSALYYEDMPEGSDVSNRMAQAISSQALTIAEKLGGYIIENEISLIIPVNVMSNPGNFALTLALILVSEALGLHVINSNHDFYWEGGKPAAERKTSEQPSVRDHFYRNMDNRPFFQLLQLIYPWNGQKWIQANINSLQSNHMIEQSSFTKDKIFELPTSVGEGLFEEFTLVDVKSARMRMGYILSDGGGIPKSISVSSHLAAIKSWMNNQKPIVLGNSTGLTIDLSSDDLIYLLQPTRVIARKRIYKDIELIGALLDKGAMRTAFDSNLNRQLVLHITGPTPIEHQADLEIILQAFVKLIETLPEAIANRIFLAFSVGLENHASLKANNLAPLGIKDIYRMATAVLFPSETEGRGLPIIEASAVGIPILCSRYHPEQVFAEVVGEGLPDDRQIRYTLFPEGEFGLDHLESVADMLMQPGKYEEQRKHNQEAVRRRFSETALTESFEELLERSRVRS